MTATIIKNKHSAGSVWAERRQDFLLVSSFGLWACLLGLSPVLAIRFMFGS